MNIITFWSSLPNWLRNCQPRVMTISRAFFRAINQDRHQLLHGSRRMDEVGRCIFLFEYSPMAEQIKKTIIKYCHLLE